MKPSLKQSEDAASETVGYLLLVTTIIMVVGMVVVVSAPVIDDAKEKSHLKNMEQGFTVLDSRLSMVALGKSPSQTTQIYSQTGNIIVDNSTFSHIKVNFSNENNTFILYNESMGTIEYRQGENTIAYEGGGVFRRYTDDSDPVMVSPPEFHYNGETLTLPIIKINTSQTVGGYGVVNLILVSDNQPNVLYPNPRTNPEYKNPLLIGKTINVEITSDYYKAWATYIRERTEATVVTNDADKTVTVILNTKPNNQDQDLEPPIDVYGFNANNASALHNFSMSLANGTSNFKLGMSSSSTYTEPYFEFIVTKSGGLGTNGTSIELNYYDNGDSEEWEWEVSGTKDGDIFEVDFLDNLSVLYKSSDDTWTWVNETPPDNGTYSNGDPGPSGKKIFQHYMSLVGPTFSLTPDPGEWDGFDQDNSTYVLYYEVLPPRITYLHVVEHKVEVYVA